VAALIRCLSQEPPETVDCAYLCDPCVQQVFKLRREGEQALSGLAVHDPRVIDLGPLTFSPRQGQFCGYRNLQMLASYMISCGVPGSERLGDKVPSIFDLQDGIEAAWRQGIRPEGLVETGGIRGTRKFIGTPEVGRQTHLPVLPKCGPN
jgi:hypothetical protein